MSYRKKKKLKKGVKVKLDLNKIKVCFDVKTSNRFEILHLRAKIQTAIVSGSGFHGSQIPVTTGGVNGFV